MKLIELILDENDLASGIEAISLVENPAIEVDFIALKKQEAIKLAEVNKEKRILMGAALIPEKPIYRRDGDDEYYIFFSKETIVQASQMYLKNGNQGQSTLEHEENITGVTVVESWIVEDEIQDKSRKFGLDSPVGTWMVSMKIDDDTIWNDYVKTGAVKGFSIEGVFADKLAKQVKADEEEELLKQIQEIMKM